MAMFSIMTYAGPALGPVISGFLELTENWRWIFYVMLMFGGITLIPLFTIPETLASAILVKKAQRLRNLQIPGLENAQAQVETTDRTLIGLYKIALSRPWRILFDPIAFAVAMYISLAYLLLYMLFTL
jgi:DHA1 family multidrug resistance protein-like MFS transporter